MAIIYNRLLQIIDLYNEAINCYIDKVTIYSCYLVCSASKSLMTIDTAFGMLILSAIPHFIFQQISLFP